MKQINFSFLVYIFVNLAIAFCCYFYPVTRDEFYYLDFGTKINYFEEYWQSYFYGNPRIGQFFCNVISRHKFLEVLFGVLLFNSFIGALFLNIYRRLPNIKSNEDISKFLLIGAVFIFLISYFGEMFFYTPFSTNYTFTHIFYLIFVYIFNEYFLYKNNRCLDNYPITVLLLFGFFMGMGNEHVPPVLLIMSFIIGLVYLLQNKKLPNFRFITLTVSVFIGYCFLFFAPANKVKQKTVDKSVFDINYFEYNDNVIKIIKTFYYYNIEIVLCTLLSLVMLFLFRKNGNLRQYLVLFLFALSPLLIVAVSPLIGTRLLFFSASVFIIMIYKIFEKILIKKYLNISYYISYLFLISFLMFSAVEIYNANTNYKKIMNEISHEKLKSQDIILRESFHYFEEENVIGRRIFLDKGDEYIDTDVSRDTSQEALLKKYFNIHSIKIAND